MAVVCQVQRERHLAAVHNGASSMTETAGGLVTQSTRHLIRPASAGHRHERVPGEE